MDFIKKHYEKVVLGVVLLLAACAVASLPFLIASEKQALATQLDEIRQRPVKPLTNLDLTLGESTVKSLETPLGADFSRPHNLLNPVQWQKGADGKLYKLEKGNEIGPEAAVVVKTTPLYLVITFNSVGPVSSGVPSGYSLGIERQAATSGAKRKNPFVKLDVKADDLITLREVKGPPEEPTELIVELADSGERVSISKEKPYKRVDSYLADLRYDPEKKSFTNRRVGDAVTIGGEAYNIVAITENEVVVSHRLTGKKSTIRKKAN